jgi:hypothetical protein
VDKRQRPAPDKRGPATPVARPATDGGSPSLWFDPPVNDQDRRHQLTRERVVAEALAVIAHDGVQGLTMRGLAARLERVRRRGRDRDPTGVRAGELKGVWVSG